VESDSAIDSYLDESVAIRIVLEFPPNESLKIFVSAESRYGTCADFIESFSITILSVVSDLLILDAYLSLSPAVIVALCFSDPARSTKCILKHLIEN
jgi:hypothetical protein